LLRAVVLAHSANAAPPDAERLMLCDAVHGLIYGLIGLMVAYMIIEQVGTWLRRRSGRD
jgi:hypothetical protein